MPYRHAHYFVGVVLLVIMGGFWASYFSRVGGPMPVAFHVHAVTSMSWLLLLIAQHVAIHRRANALHKQMGRASFVLFPFLILGFTMIINVSAQHYAAAESPFIIHNGPAFGISMVVAISAYLTLFYQALKTRRNVRLHAGYMLATPMIVFESPFSRLIGDYFPWMNIIGSEGVHAVQDTIVIGDAMMIALAMTLYFMDRKHGAPWLVASFFMALQAVTMWFAPFIPALGTFFGAYATIPPAATMTAGVALGVAAAWFGWEAGKAPTKRARQSA